MSNSRTNKRVRQAQTVEDTDISTPPPNIEVSRITIERILSKLASLELKLEQANSSLSDLALKFDDHFRNKPNDENLIPSAVKRIAKELIKIAIYPTQKQFLSKTEEFLSDNYPEFYKRVSKKNWISYYENNIFPPLLDKHRSFRGTLSSRIKDTMFAVFGDDQLTPINTSASAEEILEWKNSAAVSNCYKKKNMYIERILKKLYGPDREKRSEVQVAFAMALVEEFLNPKKDLLKIKEDTMQLRIERYLDKFRNNSYEFSDEEYDETHSDEE